MSQGTSTSEFKITAVVVAICGALVAFGVISPEQQDSIIAAAAAVAAAIASLGYSWSRGKAKSGS